MFLHLAIPGFHAAVHQAANPILRGRPVAVAVDSGDQAPLFAVSLEARSAGVWPGMRAAAARRRCPALTVEVPDADLYRRAQQACATLCGTWSPTVGSPAGGSRAGRFDADLDGTESLWRTRLRPGALVEGALEQAILIARSLVRAAEERLRLRAFCGVGARLTSARLAARLAREPAYARAAVVAVAPEQERALLDPLPIAWLPDCPRELTRTLGDCGASTLGEVRALGREDLVRMVGDGAAPLLAALGHEEEPLVPELADPEPSIAVAQRCGPAGAGPERAEAMIGKLARDLGFALRSRTLACTTVTLEARYLDGRGIEVAHRARRQLRHDDELAALALELAERRVRRVHWERLALVATGLCGAEDQLELFTPSRHHRLEVARDELRRKFSNEVVVPMAQAG